MYKHILAVILLSLAFGGFGAFIWFTTPAWTDIGHVIAKGSAYDGDVHYWMDVRTISHGIIRTDEVMDADFHPFCESCIVRVNDTLGITAYTHWHVDYDWSLM